MLHICTFMQILVSYREFEIFFPCSTSRRFRSKEITSVNGADIERVAGYKYLGIWLVEHISFKHHITNLVEKLCQKNWCFAKTGLRQQLSDLC